MNNLPQTIRRNSFEYRLICRTGRTALYEQTISEKRKAYEVFKIIISPERFFNGNLFEAMERFPNNEDFGVSAWAYTDMQRAIKKFTDLEVNHKEKSDELHSL
jgi:hypothetical protein